MRIFTYLFLLAIMNTAHSSIQIEGVIPKTWPHVLEETSLAYLNYGYTPFPSRHYVIRIVILNHLRYDKEILNKEKTINLKTYSVLRANAKFDLDSYDKLSGYYRYRLTLEPNYFADYSRSAVAEGKPKKPKKWRIMFKDGKSDYFIDGRVTFENLNPKKPSLFNIANENHDDFNLDIDKQGSLMLTQKHDVPITIEIDEI